MISGGSVNIAGKLSGTIKDISAGCQGSLYINEYDATRTGYCCAAGGGIYTSEDNCKKISQKVTDLSQEETLLKKFEKATRVTPEQAYERYQLIKQGKEDQVYSRATMNDIKKAHPNDWREIAAMKNWGLPGGGHSFEKHVIRPVLKGGPIAAIGVVVPPLAPLAAATGATVALHTATGGRTPIVVGTDHRGNIGVGPSHNSVAYQQKQQRKMQDKHKRNLQNSFKNPPTTTFLLKKQQNRSEYEIAKETVPERIRLAKELQTLFKPVNQYYSWNHKTKIYGTSKCLDNPLNIIKNAYNMKVDTTQWQSNRDSFSRLYKSLKNASISHQDILMMVGNPYAQTIQNWKNIPEARRQIIRKEYPEMDVATAAYLKWEAEHVRISNIKEGVEDCSLDFAMFASGIRGVVGTATTAWKLFFSRKVTETAVRNAAKIKKVTNDVLTEAERKGFRGIRGKVELKTPKGMGRNPDRIINGKKYWGHALDRMQDRGIPMSVVEDCIKTGKKVQSTKFASRWEYHDIKNNIKTIVEKDTGDIVDVMFGAKK